MPTLEEELKDDERAYENEPVYGDGYDPQDLGEEENREDLRLESIHRFPIIRKPLTVEEMGQLKDENGFIEVIVPVDSHVTSLEETLAKKIAGAYVLEDFVTTVIGNEERNTRLIKAKVNVLGYLDWEGYGDEETYELEDEEEEELEFEEEEEDEEEYELEDEEEEELELEFEEEEESEEEIARY